MRKTGKYLPHDCIKGMSEKLAKVIKIDRSLRRMDGMMIDSNIKRMIRLELLCHCTVRMVKELQKRGMELPEQLRHYLNREDENLMIYYNKSVVTSTKIENVLSDASVLMALCSGGNYDEVNEYQLLLRVLREQTNRQEDGSYRLKPAGDPTM